MEEGLIVVQDRRTDEKVTVHKEIWPGEVAKLCNGVICGVCPIWEKIREAHISDCTDWVKENFDLALELLGWERVGENMEEKEEKKELPFLCRWLKVNPGTVIRVDGRDWYIEKDGTLSPVSGGRVWSTECQAVYRILEHPELVEVVQNGLTEGEKEALSWLRKFVPEGSTVSWDKEEKWLRVRDSCGVEVMPRIPPHLFPSLKPGWTLRVRDETLMWDREG